MEEIHDRMLHCVESLTQLGVLIETLANSNETIPDDALRAIGTYVTNVEGKLAAAYNDMETLMVQQARAAA